MRRAAALAAVAVLLSTAAAGPVEITAKPVPAFLRLTETTDFGPLSWRGGLELASADAGFGGLSGLALSPDCSALVAVSDIGRWFRAGLDYSGGRRAGISAAETAPLLDDKGRPAASKWGGDAEALADLGDGRYLVGFERQTRIGAYDFGKSGLAARFRPVKFPKGISEGPDNGELEALGRFADGPWADHFIAVSEDNRDGGGNIRAWLWRGAETVSFKLRPHADYSVTDLAILPGGDVLTLERSFSLTTMPGMAIRRFPAAAIAAGALVEPETLFVGTYPFYEIDNMEGMALCRRDGETRLTIVSDDNFNPTLQNTLLLQFALRP